MVRLGNCTITPWHPVLHKMVWVYPADIGTVEDLPIQEVYNVILDGGHIVDVGGTLTVSLGHGFQDNRARLLWKRGPYYAGHLWPAWI
jgi:hypothetical protein